MHSREQQLAYNEMIHSVQKYIQAIDKKAFDRVVQLAQEDEGASEREQLLLWLFADDEEPELDKLWGDVFSNAPTSTTF